MIFNAHSTTVTLGQRAEVEKRQKNGIWNKRRRRRRERKRETKRETEREQERDLIFNAQSTAKVIYQGEEEEEEEGIIFKFSRPFTR